MNKDELNGNWTQIKPQLKSRWGRLTDNDLTRIEGNHDELATLLQQRYGLLKEQADKDCKAFFDSCGPKEAAVTHEGKTVKLAQKTPHATQSDKPAITGKAPLIAPVKTSDVEDAPRVVRAGDADAQPKSL